MKRFSFTKVSFFVAALAIVLVGMFRDPDMANADELGAEPVANERMPGYQSIPNRPTFEPLTADERAKLNAPIEGPVDTF